MLPWTSLPFRKSCALSGCIKRREETIRADKKYLVFFKVLII
jgi:hypothetical protein